MRSRLLLGAAGIVLLLVLLLVQAPARLVATALPAEQVVLSGLSGSLWNGRASRALIAVPGGFLHLGTLSWKLRPLSLLLFSPRLEITSEWGPQTLRGEVTLKGSQDIDLRDFEARVSASLLRQFLPVELGGNVEAQFLELAVRDGLPLRGEGRLVWQDAVWEAPQGTMPLGSYAVNFTQLEGQALAGEVVTIEGPLEAAGELELDGSDYLLDLRISAEGGLDNQIEEALSLLAAPQSDGSYLLQLDGSFE